LPIRTLAPVLMAHALSSTRTGLRRKGAAVAMTESGLAAI
jgi:hypothetical protein